MFTVAGVAGTGRTTAAARTRVVGATPGSVAVLGPPRPLAVRAAARPFPVLGAPGALAVRAARALTLGAAPAALRARPSLGTGLGAGGAGPAGTRGGLVASPETFLGTRSAPAARTLFPRRALGPAPSAVAARAVVWALGPATAAVGTTSSFGTHVVLDCLSRPVGLTIPWRKRGTVPLGDR
ncbi:hypothetical protein GCM10007079_07930 [Nocardiopsis terrae]|nr:hypothetical protein GCM10007079_07930 [Nocardiopsis terrae]